MKTITALAIFCFVAFTAAMTFQAPADARPHVAKGVGNGLNVATRGVYRGVRGVGRGVYQGARWGTRAVWVGAGVGAGHAALTRNCEYYRKRYEETRAAKWRNKYNACIR